MPSKLLQTVHMMADFNRCELEVIKTAILTQFAKANEECYFFQIPRELRDRIYRLLVDDEVHIRPLLCIKNSQLQNEAGDIWYKEVWKGEYFDRETFTWCAVPKAIMKVVLDDRGGITRRMRLDSVRNCVPRERFVAVKDFGSVQRSRKYILDRERHEMRPHSVRLVLLTLGKDYWRTGHRLCIVRCIPFAGLSREDQLQHRDFFFTKENRDVAWETSLSNAMRANDDCRPDEVVPCHQELQKRSID